MKGQRLFRLIRGGYEAQWLTHPIRSLHWLWKGCPLIPKEKGLEILDENAAHLEKGEVYMLHPTSIKKDGLIQSTAREWLATKVVEGWLSREDQLARLQIIFPEVLLDYLYKRLLLILFRMR